MRGPLLAGATYSVLRFPGVRRVGGEESEPGNVCEGRCVSVFLGRCNEAHGRKMGAGSAEDDTPVCAPKNTKWAFFGTRSEVLLAERCSLHLSSFPSCRRQFVKAVPLTVSVARPGAGLLLENPFGFGFLNPSRDRFSLGLRSAKTRWFV